MKLIGVTVLALSLLSNGVFANKTIEVLGEKDAISYTFEFVPVSAKIDVKATVKMTLIRPWEKNMEPVKTMEFEIEVK